MTYIAPLLNHMVDSNEKIQMDDDQRHESFSSTIVTPIENIDVVHSSKNRPFSAGLAGWGDVDSDHLLLADFVKEARPKTTIPRSNRDKKALNSTTKRSVSAHGNQRDDMLPLPLHEQIIRKSQRNHFQSLPVQTFNGIIIDEPYSNLKAPPDLNAEVSTSPSKSLNLVFSHPSSKVSVRRTCQTPNSHQENQSLSNFHPKSVAGPRVSISAEKLSIPSSFGGLNVVSIDTMKKSVSNSPLPQLQPQRDISARFPPVDSTSQLFGSTIIENEENKCRIFHRFRKLWKILCNRAWKCDTLEKTTQTPEKKNEKVDTLSAFECSIAINMLRKSVGICLEQLNKNLYWKSDEINVSFDRFCHVVIQNIIQPVFSKLGLDHSMDVYTKTIDLIVNNVLEIREPTKENEESQIEMENYTDYSASGGRNIHGIFTTVNMYPGGCLSTHMDSTHSANRSPKSPSGLDPSSHSLFKYSNNDPQFTESQIVKQALLLPQSKRIHLNFPEHAKTIHEDNLLRRAKLHRSWKLCNENKSNSLTALSKGEIDLRACTALGNIRHNNVSQKQLSAHSSSIHISKDKSFVLLGGATAELSGINGNMVTHASSKWNQVLEIEKRWKESTLKSHQHFWRKKAPIKYRGFSSKRSDEKIEKKEKSEQMLICCSCKKEEAYLWCEPCIAIFCQDCWAVTHQTKADILKGSDSYKKSRKPIIKSNIILQSTSGNIAKKTLESKSNIVDLSIPMLYLATKRIEPSKISNKRVS